MRIQIIRNAPIASLKRPNQSHNNVEKTTIIVHIII